MVLFVSCLTVYVFGYQRLGLGRCVKSLEGGLGDVVKLIRGKAGEDCLRDVCDYDGWNEYLCKLRD